MSQSRDLDLVEIVRDLRARVAALESAKDARWSKIATTSKAAGSAASGLVTYQATNTATEGIYAVNSAGQTRLPWAVPWGVQGFALGSASDQTGIGSSAVDVTGLSVSWTAVTRRAYRTTAVLGIQQITSASIPNLNITDGSGAGVNGLSISIAAGDLEVVTLCWVETALTGAVTRKVMASVGAGSLTIVGSFSRRASLVVEDIGPAGAPA